MKQEVDIFLKLPYFLHNPTNDGNLISCSSAYLKRSLHTWKFLIHVLLKPNLKDFEYNLANTWNESNCVVVEIFYSNISNKEIFSISLHCSFKKTFLSLLALFWNCAFRWAYFSLPPLLYASLLFPTIYKTSSDKHLAFLHFFFLGMILVTASCRVLWTSVHSSSGTLSTRSNHLNLFLTSTV